MLLDRTLNQRPSVNATVKPSSSSISASLRSAQFLISVSFDAASGTVELISPEAASSILWRDGTKAQEAATSMKITAQDMLRFGVIDSILKEPAGGAHRDPGAMIASTGDAIAEAMGDLRNLDPDAVRKLRRQKFLDIGRKLG